MTAKTRRQKLIAKLDAKARRQALERDKGVCQHCYTFYADNEVHHVFRRNIFAVRWELDNLITLCKWDCHKWAEANRKECQKWLAVTWPDRFEKIDAQRRESGRFHDTELEEKLND